MTIYSGRHELFGELDLQDDAQTVIEHWLRGQTFESKYDERDARWWVEEVCLAEGMAVSLYEEARSSYARVAEVAAFLDYLAARAHAGKVVLQHDENGVHITEWKVKSGEVTRNEKTVKRRRTPGRSERIERARANFAAQLDRHQALLAEASPEEKFEELLVRHVPRLPCVLIVGGSPEQRARAIERVSDAVGGTEAFSPGAAHSGKSAVCVPELERLTDAEQGELVKAMQEGAIRVVAGLGEDPLAAVEADRLRADLYYRLTLGRIDLERAHP